jgi:hypothetical protein
VLRLYTWRVWTTTTPGSSSWRCVANNLIHSKMPFSAAISTSARIATIQAREIYKTIRIAKILPEYEDMWPMLAPPEHRGYTFDSDLNPMIRQREQMRYDRILYRSKHLSPIQISMVGTLSALASGVMPLAEPRKEDPQRTPPRFKDYDNNSEQLYSADILRRIYPSDHFGLLSLFKLG